MEVGVMPVQRHFPLMLRGTLFIWISVCVCVCVGGGEGGCLWHDTLVDVQRVGLWLGLCETTQQQ